MYLLIKIKKVNRKQAKNPNTQTKNTKQKSHQNVQISASLLGTFSILQYFQRRRKGRPLKKPETGIKISYKKHFNFTLWSFCCPVPDSIWEGEGKQSITIVAALRDSPHPKPMHIASPFHPVMNYLLAIAIRIWVNPRFLYPVEVEDDGS